MSLSDPMFDPSDLEERRYYCVHGTFIGNPYGADYMCGYCEDGISEDEYRAILASQFLSHLREKLVYPLTVFLVLSGTEDCKPWFERMRSLDRPMADLLHSNLAGSYFSYITF